MPFGKYKGKDFTKVPKGYLRWMLRADFSADLKAAARRELDGLPQLDDVDDIVHKIVRAHGGSIHVKTKVGEGTTFTVTLPVDFTQPSVKAA